MKIILIAGVAALAATSFPGRAALAATSPARGGGPRAHAAATAGLPFHGATSAAALDSARIESLTGAHGAWDRAAGVFKVTVPRTDLDVRVGGIKIRPPMGLASWAAFESAAGHAMVMGDLVLLEDQVAPVMDAALDHGLEVTALHNHFLRETPRVMFMHVGGMGTEEALAGAIGAVFAKMHDTAAPPAEAAGPAAADSAGAPLDGDALAGVLGAKGTLAAGVYKVVLGREVRMHGASVGTTMGVNTWAAFAGSGDHAVVDGDFAVLEGELQPVLKALRHAGIEIVSIHQHMTGESPRMMFLHYWGAGPPADLARGLRAALDQTATMKAGGHTK